MILPVSLLLLAPFDPAILSPESCLADHFYGNVKDGAAVFSVLRPDAICLDNWASLASTSTLIPNAVRSTQRLVWLEQVAAERYLTAVENNSLDSFLEQLSTKERHDIDYPAQAVFDMPLSPPYHNVLFRTTSAALLSLDSLNAMVIDTLLPPFWKSTLLPSSPIPFVPVTPFSEKPAARILAGLTFNPTIASIVDEISISQMRNDVRFLTGEDESSGIASRHSFSPGAFKAALWLKSQFEYTGAVCELKPFLTGFAPNVICRYPAIVNTTATVLISAHYDSRGSFGRTRAPGGDDDGSGTMAILAIARVIRSQKIRFYSNVEVVAFAGEEQGLLGSKAYARELREKNTNLTLMVQSDMLAYRELKERQQIGLPDRIGSPVVTQLVANVSALYSPELQVGLTKVCCSDHQSFHEQGFPATQVFERIGPIADPMYHNSGDLSDRPGYDFAQAKSIAKVQFATLLHSAGFESAE